MLNAESKRAGEQVLRLLPLRNEAAVLPADFADFADADAAKKSAKSAQSAGEKPAGEPALSPDYRALVLGLIGGSRLGDIFAATPLMVAGVADGELREAYLGRLGALRVSIREALEAAEAALAAGDVAGARAWVERAAILFGATGK